MMTSRRNMDSGRGARRTRKFELQSMAVGRKERGVMEKELLVQAWVRRGCCGQLEKESVGKGASMDLSLGEEG